MQAFKLSDKSTLKYMENFYNISKDDYKSLMDSHPKDKHIIYLYGKNVPIPRFQQAYGKGYKYSGAESKAIPMTPLIFDIRKEVNKLYPNIDFNNCLVNWYLTGDNYICFHSDDEHGFVKDTPVVGVTFCEGLPRKLRIKDKISKKTLKDILTYHNSCYVMEGNFQKEFMHGIPKQKKSGKRISLTFRSFKIK